VTEFKYGAELGNAFRGNNAIKWLQNFGMLEKYCKFPVGVKLFIESLTIEKQRRMTKYFKNVSRILKYIHRCLRM